MRIGDLVSVHGRDMYMKTKPNEYIDKVGIITNVLSDPYDGSLRIDGVGGPGFGRYMEHEVWVIQNEEE